MTTTTTTMEAFRTSTAAVAQASKSGIFTGDGGGDEKACANCGATQDLLRCSRCHQAWFCSVKCQKAYWPFHRSQCRRNDFADSIEAVEPKFASWMRKHGKIAVLKDDEVDRLERANKATTGKSREQVMESMYGKADPKPLPPSYTAEDLRKMRENKEQLALKCRKILTVTDKVWSQIKVPKDLGLDCGEYKWSQSQAYVEIFVKLPVMTASRRVEVRMEPTFMAITINGGDVVMHGDLYREIKQDESTWFINDGILEICLLKRYRRGLTYMKGETNANTYWYSIFKDAKEDQMLQLKFPPTSYYNTEWQIEEVPEEYKQQTRRRIGYGGKSKDEKKSDPAALLAS
eukprot:CAMPEP_0182608080 /NCGR_PEP_ID=MMETSP1330-20130603/2602_1 /TAXON_ID=464278 /ORGANISM="Picochlorum sp., Strain RCC944" /LENGTH=345 /DNA_ID=CAMNT_0024826781 /DNA_START=49 /DNA_END=1086 /DNA_ORIENTATION=+